MKHASEEELILAHFEGDRAVTRHLTECLSCRGRMTAIQRVLAAVEAAPVPERGDHYGREVWKRIAMRLEERPETTPERFFTAPRLAFAGLVAAMALAVFLAGRFWQDSSRAPLAALPPSERVLLAAVGEHLDRSQAVLTELFNSPAGALTARGGARAEELLAANRLYRLSAASAGDRAVTDVLDELERVLLEVSHIAASASPEELEKLRKRSEEMDVLFKIRVLGSRVRQREAAALRDERKRT